MTLPQHKFKESKASLLSTPTDICRSKKPLHLKAVWQIKRKTEYHRANPQQRKTVQHCASVEGQKPRVTKQNISNTLYISNLTPWGKTSYLTHSQPERRDNVRQSKSNHSVADIHVLFMAIISTVDFGLLHRTWCAVTFYWLRRQSRIIWILSVLSLFLTVITLLFCIVIPGDLWKKKQMMWRPYTLQLCFLQCVIYSTNLNISFIAFYFSLPVSFLVFTFFFLAAGAFTILATALLITLAVPFLFPFLFLLVSVKAGEKSNLSKWSRGYL